jgi:hypothetical protein
MPLKTITNIMTDDPMEALYVYVADPSVAPVQSESNGRVIWEITETAKNKKAIADLQDPKKKVTISIEAITDKNLAAVGLEFSTITPKKARRGRPPKNAAKAAKAPKAAKKPGKRGRPKGSKGGKRIRLNDEQKKFIAELAKKGKGQTEIQKEFSGKFGHEPSYATIHNYVTAARKSK